MTPRIAIAALAVATLAAAGCASARRDARARDVQRALAERLAEQGDWGGAFRAADALLKEAPEDVGARLLRGRALRHAGAATEAEADLTRVLVADPHNALAHSELGVLCEADGRRDEALRHHREARRLDPGSPRTANNLGVALVMRGQLAEAVEVFEAGLRDFPGDARLRNNLGFALAERGDFARAKREFTLAGNEAQARHNLGVAHERRGELPRAWQLYVEAARLDPDRRLPRENLINLSRKLARPVPKDLAEAAEASKGAP